MSLSFSKHRVFIAVDLGETNSAVSYYTLPASVNPIHANTSGIKTISKYPSAFFQYSNDSMRLEAPTQLFYPPGWVFRPLKDLWDAPPGDASSAHPNGNPQNQNQNQGSNAPSRRLLWGGQAYQVMSQITAQSNRSGTLVHRFKTMMDPSENHKRHKQDLGEILRHLSQNHTGKDPIPVEEMVLLVTIDYLTKLLEFAKGQIHLDSSQITSTEMIICVPIIWSQKAIRNMQFCMGLAAKLSGFPGVELQNKSIDNVFIMAEPEAGATWLLGRGFKSIEVLQPTGLLICPKFTNQI